MVQILWSSKCTFCPSVDCSVRVCRSYILCLFSFCFIIYNWYYTEFSTIKRHLYDKLPLHLVISVSGKPWQSGTCVYAKIQAIIACPSLLKKKNQEITWKFDHLQGHCKLIEINYCCMRIQSCSFVLSV